jgi:hypothetical protein
LYWFASLNSRIFSLASPTQKSTLGAFPQPY